MLTHSTLAMLQLVTPITVASPPPSEKASTELATPVSVGRPHACTEAQYPISALQRGTEGKTVLRYTVTADGHVRDISVDTSSGNAELDAAAIACASDWQYRPATHSGVAIEMPWKANVNWKIAGSGDYGLVDFRILLCVAPDRATIDELKKAPLHPVVRVHYAKGVIISASLAGTSGNSDLDSRVLACYRNVPAGLTATVPDGDEVFAVMLPDKVVTDHF